MVKITIKGMMVLERKYFIKKIIVILLAASIIIGITEINATAHEVNNINETVEINNIESN